MSLNLTAVNSLPYGKSVKPSSHVLSCNCKSISLREEDVCLSGMIKKKASQQCGSEP